MGRSANKREKRPLAALNRAAILCAPEPSIILLTTQRFQFSIRLLLVWTAVIATAAWGGTSKSNLVAAIALNAMAFLPCSLAIVAATLTIGKSRTFWIGAAIPAGTGGLFALLHYYVFLEGSFCNPPSWALAVEYLATQLRAGLPPIWCLAIFNGLLCAAVHWLVWPQPSEQGP